MSFVWVVVSPLGTSAYIFLFKNSKYSKILFFQTLLTWRCAVQVGSYPIRDIWKTSCVYEFLVPLLSLFTLQRGASQEAFKLTLFTFEKES